MFKQAIALLCLFIYLPLPGYAETISYNGYTLDTETNIVTGGGLEWLQWDVTVGQSINTALTNYGGDGWRTATNTEMAALYNEFGFGVVFDTDENTPQSATLVDDQYSFGSANEFINLFGDTYQAAGNSYNYGDQFERSSAVFGGDQDSDNLYNLASVSDEYTSSDGDPESGRAYLHIDYIGASTTRHSDGVALVRVSIVPVPAAAWLFGSALVGLVGFKRNK